MGPSGSGGGRGKGRARFCLHAAVWLGECLILACAAAGITFGLGLRMLILWPAVLTVLVVIATAVCQCGGLLPDDKLRDLALIGSSYVGFTVFLVAGVAVLGMKLGDLTVVLVGWPLVVTVAMVGVGMCARRCERGEAAQNELRVTTRAALLFLRVLAANGELGV